GGEALQKGAGGGRLQEPTIRLGSLSEAGGQGCLELVRELSGLRDEQTSRPHAVASPPAAGSPGAGSPDAGSPADGLAGADLASDDLAEVRQLPRPPPP